MAKLLGVLSSPNASSSIIKIAVSTITECGRLEQNNRAINEANVIDQLFTLLRGGVAGEETVMIQVCSIVRPQLFALNCSPSTVCPQLFALN
jgi:hypothetical protein